ncbi:hypothetical protein BYT27DRAFT_6918223 [Phlegmacium glaucopus]|nr:hypothetical protein BYT27DRAFT_6918223 [Phlegmacium glaucopus]
MDHHFLSNIPWAQNTESNPSKALRCVTIRQILHPTLGSPSFSFGMLMLVANVYSQSIDSQGLSWFGFDDGLGKVDGYKTEGDFIFEPFAYARIIGELEHRGDRKLLKIFHIEPVYEAHEIFHHLLHVIMDTLISERGPPPVDRLVPSSHSSPALLKPSQGRMDHIIAALQEMSYSNDSSVRTSQDQTQISDSEDELLPDTAPHLALSTLQADIIACISTLQFEAGGDMGTGVPVISVVQKIHSRHPNITVLEFSAAAEQLLGDGVIYNTIDDLHYACRRPRLLKISDVEHRFYESNLAHKD